MRQPAEFLLRRRGDGQRADTRGQGGNRVHDHGAGVDGQAAGNVQAHAAHRNPALGHRRAGGVADLAVPGNLLRGKGAGAGDGFLKPGTDLRVQFLQGADHGLGRHPGVGLGDAVEAFGQLAQGGEALGAHAGDDALDGLGGRGEVQLGARQHRLEARMVQRGTPQI